MPKYFLLISALILLMTGCYSGTAILDIHFHDTYYVIEHWYILPAIFLLLQALIYFLTDKFRQISALKYIHVASICLFACFLLYYDYYFDSYPERYAAGISFKEMFDAIRLEQVLALFLLVLVLGHLLFVLNLVIGFVRGKKPTHPHNNAV